MRGDIMAKRSSFGKTIKKKLSDITNYQPQPKSPPVFDQFLPQDAKEQIDLLLKENASLKKLITDKNKVIEANGAELQKLRVVAQKTQLQNWSFAQANSHMMAELNLGKQKVKSLQHQLTCKDALLKTMNLELKAEREMNDQKDDDKPTRSQSICPWMTGVEQVSEKETVHNKRRCVRRARSQGNEKLFEIKDLKMDEGGPTSIEQNDGKESQRMSLSGRPSRRASEKVQSYKENPINIKMRRPE